MACGRPGGEWTGGRALQGADGSHPGAGATGIHGEVSLANARFIISFCFAVYVYTLRWKAVSNFESGSTMLMD